MLPQILLQGLLASAFLVGCATATTVVTVNGTASHSISPLLYGLMFEDINSGDGGLYAELLQNRAFQQVIPNTTDALAAWNAINAAEINVVADSTPVSAALPNSLELTIPQKASGQVGFSNSGYWGIRVNSDWTYNVSFYYRFPATSSFNGAAIIALQSSSGQVCASASVPIKGSQTTWSQVNLYLKPTVTPNSTANNFTVTFDGAEAAGQTIRFAMFSLFPPTFKNRENGMRIDIATALYEAKPSFFRLPGGNNLGENFMARWVWNATVGPLVGRPGRWGDWGYINTDGLGLLEYMYFCEDVDMEPIMAVWSGYSLNKQSVPEDDLTPYIQAAINQINFIIGDPATNEYAALRASLGRPEPFKLNYVEIGNEDFFASQSYTYRWRDFVGNLTNAFPQLKFIATSYPFNPILDPVPKYYDLHLYETSQYFIEHSFDYDKFQRNGTYYFEGEYAVNTPGPLHPILQDSLAEAAFMIGFERNSDIVFAAAYAPLLVNMNAANGNSLVAFENNSAAEIYPTTSYYVQQLLSIHRGSEYLPSTLPTFNGTLYWSVTRDMNSSSIMIKVVNAGAAPAPVTFMLPFQVAPTGNLTVLTGAPNATDSPTTPNAVIPKTSSISFAQIFNYTAPAYSLSVAVASIL